MISPRERWVDVDGELVAAADRAALLDDEGFFHGHGLYETVLGRSGRPVFLEAHLGRMAASAAATGLPAPPDAGELRRRITSVLEANGLTGAEARVNLRLSAAEFLVRARAVDPGLEGLRREGGVALSLSLSRTRPRARHKTVERPVLLDAAEAARRAGAVETLLFDPDGKLLEGATSNVFCVRGGRLHTPELDRAILPGVTRGVVLELARELGMEVREVAPRLEECQGSDEIFITSAVRLIVPVVRLDTHPIGDGVPGPVTRALAGALEERVARV